MSSELIELVEFLHSPQPAVRAVALENVASYSQSPKSYIFKNDDYRPIKDLKALARDKTARTVQLALSILANLSGDPVILDLICTDDFITFVVTSILDFDNTNADLFCILLADMGKSEKISQLLKLDIAKLPKGSEEIFKSKHAIDCLMDCFVKGSERALNKYANFDYLAFFFADISRFADGRDYFTKEKEYDGVVPIVKLLVFSESSSKTRRAGVASTIKNVLFDVYSHQMLLDKSSVNLLPYILLPLAGGEELKEEEMFQLPDELQFLPSDKQREPDLAIKTTFVESVLLLCTTKPIREHLRSNGVYFIIRELHKSHEDDDLRDFCERVVQMLVADEPEENVPTSDAGVDGADEGNESDDDIIEVL